MLLSVFHGFLAKVASGSFRSSFYLKSGARANTSKKGEGFKNLDQPTNSSYQQALYQAKLTSLASRRELLCQKLMAAMRDVSHPISFLAPQETIRTLPYQLRSGNTIPTRTMKKTKRANDFFTFRFG